MITVHPQNTDDYSRHSVFLFAPVFHLAISNMAQRHVAFCERHAALQVRHVALQVRPVPFEYSDSEVPH